jgi:molybdenum cofactor biosynthesis enzyme
LPPSKFDLRARAAAAAAAAATVAQSDLYEAEAEAILNLASHESQLASSHSPVPSSAISNEPDILRELILGTDGSKEPFEFAEHATGSTASNSTTASSDPFARTKALLARQRSSSSVLAQTLIDRGTKLVIELENNVIPKANQLIAHVIEGRNLDLAPYSIRTFHSSPKAHPKETFTNWTDPSTFKPRLTAAKWEWDAEAQSLVQKSEEEDERGDAQTPEWIWRESWRKKNVVDTEVRKGSTSDAETVSKEGFKIRTFHSKSTRFPEGEHDPEFRELHHFDSFEAERWVDANALKLKVGEGSKKIKLSPKGPRVKIFDRTGEGRLEREDDDSASKFEVGESSKTVKPAPQLPPLIRKIDVETPKMAVRNRTEEQDRKSLEQDREDRRFPEIVALMKRHLPKKKEKKEKKEAKRAAATPSSFKIRQHLVGKGGPEDSETIFVSGTGAAAGAGHLPHLTAQGAAHMVSVSNKPSTLRRAIAIGFVVFSHPDVAGLIRQNLMKKGDVLGTARIAGVMAAKKCPELIPLCHTLSLTKAEVAVELRMPNVKSDPDEDAEAAEPLARGKNEAYLKRTWGYALRGTALENRLPVRARYGCVRIEALVETNGPTGVEMEALTAVSAAGLTVIDMVKAVDRFASLQGVQMVMKFGGKSGLIRDESWVMDRGRIWIAFGDGHRGEGIEEGRMEELVDEGKSDAEGGRHGKKLADGLMDNKKAVPRAMTELEDVEGEEMQKPQQEQKTESDGI